MVKALRKKLTKVWSTLICMSEERFINIETKVAHQEAMTEELNIVLYQQQVALDQIQKTLAEFIKRYKELEKSTQDIIGPADEKPPHY